MIDALIPPGFEFGSPWALLLLTVPAGLLLAERIRRRRSPRWTSLPRGGLPRSVRSRLLFIPPLLRALALAALVIAIARPRLGVGRMETSADAIAIEMVVDRSGSMRQPMELDGVEMTRLDAVKHVVREFLVGNGRDLAGRRGDLIGLVSFAGYAETACPPVRDPRTLADLVDAISLAQYQYEQGTAVGEALALAAARLKTAEQDLKNRTDAENFEDLRIKSKVILLLTDGSSNRGQDPIDAAKLAQDWGIKVYTIGVGAGGAPYRILRSPAGDLRVPVGDDVDEQSLTRIAEMTGGLYRRAEDGEALRRVYEEIDRLEKTSVKTTEYVDYTERFAPFAAAGGIMLAGSLLLGASVLRRGCS